MAWLRQSDNEPIFSVDSAANIRVMVFAALSLVLMTLDHREQHLEQVRNILATAIYPLQALVDAPFALASWSSDTLASRRVLLEENASLKRKQLLIGAQLQKLTALEAENRRLRLLLESSVRLGERVLIAELLKVDFDPYRHQILINKGTRHGVHAGQPLLDEAGILGQIVHANAFTSTAILITDPNHAVPVQVNRNGLRTLAVGTGNFQLLELPHVPNNDDIWVGDLLITSGLGGHFPRGYPVARVIQVEFDPSRPFARVLAKPIAHLDRRREVLLIVGEPEVDAVPDDAQPIVADTEQQP